MLRIGAVCSSSGSVLIAAYEILKNCGYNVHFSVATDRQCGVEMACEQGGIVCRRIEDSDRDSFSARVAQWLYEDQKVQLVCLFFSRLVGEALFARGPCINFHPSLLPAFTGFGPLEAGLKAGVRFFGATAHLVDKSVDMGPIVAQVAASLPCGATLQEMERVSFAQKLYLMLAISEVAHDGKLELLRSCSGVREEDCWAKFCNPAISSRKLIEAFCCFVKAEGIPWLGPCVGNS